MPERDSSLIDLMRSASYGAFDSEASQALTSLIANLHSNAGKTGKAPKGLLTIKIAMKIEDGRLEIRPSYDVRSPSPNFLSTVAWADEKGQIHKQNPMQTSLALGSGQGQQVRTPESEQPEVRTAREAEPDVRNATDGVRDIRNAGQRAGNDR